MTLQQALQGNPQWIVLPEQTRQQLQTRWQQLQARRIRVDSHIPPKQFLMHWQGHPALPRGEVVAVNGKAKSGKSFFCSMMMAASIRGECLAMQTLEQQPLRFLWIDTEQSEDTTYEILSQRIQTMARQPLPEDRYALFNLRQERWQDRLQQIIDMADYMRPDLIIFDGIRDVMDDINNGPLAQEVMEQITSLASRLRCCVVCVLHQNKSPEDLTMRGAIGTELLNKGFEVYECKGDEGQMQVKQTQNRKELVTQPMYYRIDQQGLPFLTTAPEADNTTAKQPVDPRYLLPNGYVNEQIIIPEALADRHAISHVELRQYIMAKTHVPEVRAAGAIKSALNSGLLLKLNQNGRTWYTLNYQQKQLFSRGEEGSSIV